MIELRRRYGKVSGGGQPSRLPAGYQEVEYIQNIEESYIVLPFNRADIKFRFCVTPDDNINSMQMGYGATKMVGFIKNAGVDVITPVVNGFAQSLSIPTSATTIHTIEIRHSNNVIIIDGQSTDYSDFTNDGNFGIFVRASYNTPKMKGKMYVLQRNYGEGYIDQYIPCRRISDNVKGMYDIVNDVFYTNAGTGEFSCGMDVGGGNVPATKDYMEFPSIGGCFDTGYKPNSSTTIELDFMPYLGLSTDCHISLCANSTWDNRIGVWTFGGYIQAAKTSSSGSYILYPQASSYNTRLKITIINNVATCDDGTSVIQVEYSTSPLFSCQSSFIIGSGSVGGNVNTSDKFIGRIYAVKIHEDGTLIHDYRAYTDDQMVDLVTSELFPNVGTYPTLAKNEE